MATGVLVTAAGSIVAQGIIKCLKIANKQRKDEMEYQIIGSDISANASGLYRTDVGIIVPPVTSPSYLDHIIKTCNEKRVKAVFIGSDEELLPLTEAKEKIEAESGAVVITNPVDVISKAGDKWKTFEFLKQNGVHCADSALPDDKERFIEKHGFPLVVKPREGHGSLHFYIVHDIEEIEGATKAIYKSGWRPLLQEYLREQEDIEFTSGITTDQSGNVMSSISMRKILKNGQTYKAFIDDYKEARESAKQTAVKIGARGPINVQAKSINGQAKIFEINARFSATTPLRAVAGINEPDILFRNAVLGESTKLEKYERLVCMRYWNEVYVPYATYEKAANSKIVIGSESFIPSYF